MKEIALESQVSVLLEMCPGEHISASSIEQKRFAGHTYSLL